MRQTATRAEIDAFERRIRALIAEGYAVPFAVRQAYREYSVMRILFGELIDQIREEAERGYGEALPRGITDRLFTQSWTPDGLTLSERTTRGGILVRELVARTISEQIKKSATYRQASLAIFDPASAMRTSAKICLSGKSARIARTAWKPSHSARIVPHSMTSTLSAAFCNGPRAPGRSTVSRAI